MTKLPAFQFYPADWRKDIGVQSLSYHDRGVWFEILCLMHESEQRGKLLLNGKAMPNEVLSRLLGLDKQGLHQALERIKAVGVASVDESGVLTNRRMVKDEYIRQVRKKAGEQGGNPVLLNQEDKQKPSKPASKTEPLPLQSSTSEEEKKKTTNVVSKKPATTARKKIPDDEFLTGLADKSAYSHISIPTEFEKAQVWCETNGRQCTRKFFVGWINRIQKPMEIKGNGSNKNNNQRSNADIIRNRDASKFAGIDPQKQFGIKRG